MNNIDFYKALSYSNNIEYVRNNISRNVVTSEILNKNILDYGCGIGDASYILDEYAPETVTGIDVGESNICICNSKKTNKKHISFIQADLNNYDLGLDKYDFIWSDTTVEFLEKNINEILLNFKQCMKSGGVLYLSFTKRTLGNILIYKILSFVKFVFPERFRGIFYYLILLKYWLSGVKNTDKENIKNKVKYLFVPYIKLISEKQVLGALSKSSFELIYIRDRIKSDINSPPHTELKAVLKNES